jgi:cell division protein FtsQ
MATGVREGQGRTLIASPKPKAASSSSRSGPKGAAAKPKGFGKLAAARNTNITAGPALGIALGVVGLVALIVAVTGDRPQKMGQAVSAGFINQTAAWGYKVQHIQIVGASAPSQKDILRASTLQAGLPILGLDLAAVRASVEQVGWVSQVKVARLLPDTVLISVVERPRLAVWQHQGINRVIDAQGRVIMEANAAGFGGLPLVVGEGADLAAPSLVPLILSRPRLASRLEAMVRVDRRRWDLKLKDGSLVQLPATGEAQALAQLDRLDKSSRLLELGLARLDLRDPTMLVVRPRYAGGSYTSPGTPE